MKLLLIDGYSILHRTFYGIPDLTNSKGIHTNAVYGFLNIMFKLLDEERPTHLAVAFDMKEKTFRHEMYADYKGGRKPMPDELSEQIPLMKNVLNAMKIPCVFQAQIEADDILGTLARLAEKSDYEVLIVSGDRDLLQIASKNTTIIIPKTKYGKTDIFRYNDEGVKELYGVTPSEFIDMKALMGDSSDNIPGLPGVGEVTAKKLIMQYHSIENCYEHVEEITLPKAKKAFIEHYDLAVMSKKLAEIKTDARLDFNLDDAVLGNIYTADAFALIREAGFKSMYDRFEAGLYNLSEKEPEVVCVTDEKSCDELLSRAVEFSASLAVGACIIKNDRTPVCLGLCFHENKVYVCSGFDGWIYGAVKNLLECGVIWLDVRDAMSVLEGEDCYKRYSYYDIGLAAYLLNPLKSSYGYDEIASDYMNVSLRGAEVLLGKHGENISNPDKKDEVYKCAANNAWVCSYAFEELEKKLDITGQKKLYLELELPVLGMLFRMSCTGIVCKKEALKEYGDSLVDGIDKLEKEIYQETGCEFNIKSPKQLGEVLFDKMGLKGAKKTKTGYSTSAEVLEKIDHPVVRKILDYRQLTKLKSTYADGLAAFIASDGRIHGKFNQTITATGRISSTEPNLQNIPVRMELGRAIRRVFVPKEGCVFVDADYSQIELRILAHMSNDQNLIDAYKHSSDIHAATASIVFGVPLEDVTSEMRRSAKAVNFGIVYGISAFGLSEDLSIGRKQAARYIDAYFKNYPGVKSFLDEQVKIASEKGYVTTMFGRIRPIPEIKMSNFAVRSFGERAAMNSPIQGTAADIMKMAMLNVENALERAGLKARIVLQIHDELLVETPEDEVEQVKDVLRKNMTDAFNLSIPLDIGISVGNSWYETK